MEALKFDTVIVGGGIAGLTSAVYLARAGQKILLLEKNKEFGGLVSSFKRDGFHFEAGVRALENAGIIIPMLDDLDIKLDWVRSKVSVGIEDIIVSVDNIGSIQAYRDMLVNLFSEDKEEIDRFIKSMRTIMKHSDVLYGIENPLFKDLKKDKAYIFKKLLPWLPKFMFTVAKMNRLNKPFEKFLEEVITTPSLRDVISQHFFKGTPTFFALSYFSLYLDYFYPKGGVDQLVDALVNKIREYNGELVSNVIVKELHADEKYVVDNLGKPYYYYNNLIWAADLKMLYQCTNTEGLDSKTQRKIRANKTKVMASKGSESVFSLYLEVDLPVSYFSDIAHGHFFYTPSKVGLDDIHRGELKELIDTWQDANKAKVFSWLDRFLSLNTFEISIPAIKDESLAPKNKTGVIASFIIEYELFKKAKESGWYGEFVDKIESTMIHLLSYSVYPELKGRIQKQFSFTPISICNRISSSDGAIVGWSFESSMPAVNTIQSSGKSVLTPIPHVFQAGQWTYSPAGVPMSILTGKLAADRVYKSKLS